MFSVQRSVPTPPYDRCGRTIRALRLMLPLTLLAVVAACEVPDTDADADAPGTNAPPANSGTTGSGGGSPTTPTTGNGTAGTTADNSAQAEWDAIRWHTSSGPSAKGATQVMTLSASVKSDGQSISFTWDKYPWPDYGLGHFFVWDGTTWKGGKFDWIRTGGQSIKGTVNIREHYNGLSIPPSGTAVAFAWTNAKGTQRSNLAKTTWP